MKSQNNNNPQNRFIQIGPRLPRSLREALRIAAARTGKSESNIVEEALQSHPDVKKELAERKNQINNYRG